MPLHLCVAPLISGSVHPRWMCVTFACSHIWVPRIPGLPTRPAASYIHRPALSLDAKSWLDLMPIFLHRN